VGVTGDDVEELLESCSESIAVHEFPELTEQPVQSEFTASGAKEGIPNGGSFCGIPRIAAAPQSLTSQTNSWITTLNKGGDASSVEVSLDWYPAAEENA
jgi:hypothetical protein